MSFLTTRVPFENISRDSFRDLPTATIAPIPGPSTMLSFCSGLAGLALWRFQKNVKA